MKNLIRFCHTKFSIFSKSGLTQLATFLLAFLFLQTISVLAGGNDIFVDSNVGVGVVEIVSDGQCSLIEAIINANDDVVTHADCIGGDGVDTIILDGSIFTLNAVNNTSANGDNGLPVITTEIVIQGKGSTIERDDAAENFRILEVSTSGILTISKIKITKGQLLTNRSTLNDGGGIFNGGILTINKSEISQNSGSNGGGIINRGSVLNGTGTLTINNSNISDNNGGSGAGIFSISNSGTNPAILNINNSTISGNSSNSTGGGIISGTSSTMTIRNSTITNNSAGFGGGIANSFNTNATISNSIVAGNTASSEGPNCRFSSEATIINDGGNNLSNDGNTGPPGTTMGFSSIFECFDPSAVMTTETDFDIDCLDVLDFYGGVTQTHALINPMMGTDCETNLALDVSMLDCSGAPISDVDQRLFPRDSNCDIGAFELQDTATVNVTKVTVPANGTDYIFDVTRMGDPTLILSCFTLDDTQSQNIITPLDTVTVTEQVPDGFELSIDCDSSTGISPDPVIDNNTGTVDAVLDSDTDILDCTFTNSLLCDVTVNVTGTGQGTVTGDGIDCDETGNPTCSITAPFGDNLDLDAAQDSGSTFDGFSGDCDGNGIITIGTGDDINGCSDTCTAQFSDIDDCSPDPCQNGGVCTDTGANSFSCDCTGTGYEGDTCDTDVDECTDGTDNCNANATCSNTVGSFTCECNTGFTGDGVTCTDIDACVNNACGENATCTDNPAPALDNAEGRTCECNAGFEGDGITCTDIDACINNPCDTNATCADNPEPALDNAEGRTCECNDGFTGDGETCTELADGVDIDNGTATNNGIRVGIKVGNDIAGGGRVLVELPPGVFATLAQLVPDIGDCEIVENGQTTNVTDPDVICDINDFPGDFDLNLELCADGDLNGTANAVIEVEVDNSQEEFEEVVQILLSALDSCDDSSSGESGGCSIASAGTNKANALGNLFVILAPAIVGFAGLFFRKRK